MIKIFCVIGGFIISGMLITNIILKLPLGAYYPVALVALGFSIMIYGILG